MFFVNKFFFLVLSVSMLLLFSRSGYFILPGVCLLLCFFAAFFLPITKMLEAPALLSKYAAGDILVPALGHYLLQAAVLAALLFLISRLDKP